MPELVRSVLIASLIALCATAHAAPPPWDLRALADQNLAGFDKLPDYDQGGYGDLAWGVSYGMLALDVLYDATGDVAYLRRLAPLCEDVMARRDVDLAAQYGPARYTDFTRGRVLQAWGCSTYSQSKHLCWLVHAGMLLYPMAEYVRLVYAGREQTAPLRYRAKRLLPQIVTTVHEFDADWRDGPVAGQGYYVLHDGVVAPHNMMNAMAGVLFVLHELTGKAVYLDRATKMAAFMKAKLTHVTSGDYYVWAYRTSPPEGPPATGEDISHASLNALLMYQAWQHHVVFDDTDMARLTRTVTVGLNLGAGQLAGVLGTRKPNDAFTPQAGRWGFLARFDPQVEQILFDYAQAHPDKGRFSSTTGALGYAYLLRARKLR